MDRAVIRAVGLEASEVAFGGFAIFLHCLAHSRSVGVVQRGERHFTVIGGDGEFADDRLINLSAVDRSACRADLRA